MLRSGARRTTGRPIRQRSIGLHSSVTTGAPRISIGLSSGGSLENQGACSSSSCWSRAWSRPRPLEWDPFARTQNLPSAASETARAVKGADGIPATPSGSRTDRRGVTTRRRPRRFCNPSARQCVVMARGFHTIRHPRTEHRLVHHACMGAFQPMIPPNAGFPGGIRYWGPGSAKCG